MTQEARQKTNSKPAPAQPSPVQPVITVSSGAASGVAKYPWDADYGKWRYAEPSPVQEAPPKCTCPTRFDFEREHIAKGRHLVTCPVYTGAAQAPEQSASLVAQEFFAEYWTRFDKETEGGYPCLQWEIEMFLRHARRAGK